MRTPRLLLILVSVLAFCSITIAQDPAPPTTAPLHVEQTIPSNNAVLFVAPEIGGKSFGFFKAPDGTAVGVPVLEVNQAMQAGYKPVTLGELTQGIESYVKTIEQQQKQLSELTSDYNALVVRFNRLAAINSTTPAATYAPPHIDERQAMRLMLFQSLLSRTAPPARVQVTDCTAYPALCVH